MDVSLPDRPLRRVIVGAIVGVGLGAVVYLVGVFAGWFGNELSVRQGWSFLFAGAVVCATGMYLARGVVGACAGLIAGALLGSSIAGDLARPTLARHHIGQEAKLSGITLAGTQYDISSHRGNLVLVDFWATWCPPCRKEMPRLKSLYERYHDAGLDIVGVSLDKDHDALKAFVKREELPWPQIYTEGSGEAWENPIVHDYMIRSIPYTLLVDRNGKIIASGLVGASLEEAIDKVLAGGKPSPPSAFGFGEPLTNYFAVFGWFCGMLVERRLRSGANPKLASRPGENGP